MPLVSVEKIDADVQLGLWKIEEQDSELCELDANPFLKSAVMSCGSLRRRAEIVSVYSLLHAMTSAPGLFIDHTPEGRPIIKGADINVGVSHTNGYATLIMSHTKNVSVDIEYINDRVDRIAERFIRDDETALCTLSRLVHWCVKETLYKYFSEQKLGYYEMRLHPFELSSEGKVLADNLRENTTSAVFYKIADEYVITYMFA